MQIKRDKTQAGLVVSSWLTFLNELAAFAEAATVSLISNHAKCYECKCEGRGRNQPLHTDHAHTEALQVASPHDVQKELETDQS